MLCHSTLGNPIDSSKAVGTFFDNNGVCKQMFPLLGPSLVFLSVCLFMIFISNYLLVFLDFLHDIRGIKFTHIS